MYNDAQKWDPPHQEFRIQKKKKKKNLESTDVIKEYFWTGKAVF